MVYVEGNMLYSSLSYSDKGFSIVFFVNCVFSSQRKSKSSVTELFDLWCLETNIEIHGLLQKAVFFSHHYKK